MRSGMRRNVSNVQHTAMVSRQEEEEAIKLKKAAEKVRVGVRLSDNRSHRRSQGRRRPQRPTLQLEDAEDDADQLSPLPTQDRLRSASAFYDATPRSSAAETGSEGAGADAADAADEALDDDLVFSERALPTPPFEYAGCFHYVVFLMLYTLLALEGRNKSTYQFGQFARDSGAVDEFMTIDSVVDYRDWLEVGFFPGLRMASYAASSETGIILVGPPRLRQIVGSMNCTISPEMAGMPLSCFEDVDSGETTGWPQPADSPFKFTWASAEETGEGTYGSTSGYTYQGGGFLLNGTGRIVQRVPTIARASSELFPFAHSRISVEDLFYSGWMTDRTRAVFHDYALYSANKDAYVSVRLVLEYGPEHGGFLTSKHVRIFFLNKWPDRTVILEMTFYTVLFLLIASDLKELLHLVKEAEQQLKDHIVRQRFRLRLRILQHAAFAAIFQYRPKVLMAQVASRLNDPALGDDRRFHIEKLNAIGAEIPKLHDKYRRYLRSDENRPPSSTDQALAVLDVLDIIRVLDTHQQEVDTLSNSKAWLVKKQLIKLRAGLRVYMTNGWRVLDAVNYCLFLFTCFARFTLNDLMKTCESEVAALPRMDTDGDTGLVMTPWDDDSKFVRFYGIAFWTTNITYAFAFNAVLTWIKIFKYLNYFPNMQILTKTLGVAARPLAWFCLIILIVLIGAGQGFFLAFGLDVKGYRSFVDSVLALLRMAVGDFEYEDLEESHRHLGPLMFWMYIFLMFFVLMSVFIALIAESYEEAKSILAAENDEVKKMAPEIITNQVVRHNIRGKALKQFNDAVECRLLSPPLTHHLAQVASGWHKTNRSAGSTTTLRKRLSLCIPGAKVSPAEDDGTSPLEMFDLRHKTRDDDRVNHHHPLDVFTSDEDDDDYDESADLIGGGGAGSGGDTGGAGGRKNVGNDTPTEGSSIAARRFNHRQYEMEQLEAEAADQKAEAIRVELAPLQKRLDHIDLQISQDRRSMQQQLDRIQQTNELMFKLLSSGGGAPGLERPPEESEFAREVRTNHAVPAHVPSDSSMPSQGETRHAEAAVRAESFRKVERNSVGHVNHVNDVMAFTKAVLNKRGGATSSLTSTRNL
eukprot:COSAG02_NODE_533_length_20665_cov_216.617281_16_plen_1091_part_00